MNRKLRSVRGETLSELLAAVLIAVWALYVLCSTLTALFPAKAPSGGSEQTPGVIIAVFKLGYSSYESEIEVVYGEDGYTFE